MTDDAALELAIAHALVRRASDGEIGEALHVYRPQAPVVVFGRRDTHAPGFPAAAAAAERAGFRPLVRATGGRAVAYTGAALVLDHVRRTSEAVGGMERRFEEYGELIAGVLRELGIDARVGAVPGEYCPGAQSVNARGVVKLVGTSQRIVKNAWLFSSLVVLGDANRIGPVLSEVYAALGQPFDVASVGSVADERAGEPAAVADDLERRLLAAYAQIGVGPTPPDDRTLALAAELVPHHVPDVRPS